MNSKLLEEMKNCSYPNNMKETIANVIVNIAKMTKNLHLNKFARQSRISTDVILLLKCQINVLLKERFYDIPINIIIPKSFPYEQPEFYLDKTQDIGINTKNYDIDPKSLRIWVYTLKNWNMYCNSNIISALQEIIISFNNNFPIFRLTNKSLGLEKQISSSKELLGTTILPIKDNQEKTIYMQPKGGQTDIKIQSVFKKENESPYYTNEFNNLDFNSKLKRIMIDELRFLIDPKIREEFKKLIVHQGKLANYKREFEIQNDKIHHFIKPNEGNLIRITETLQNIQYDILEVSQFIALNKNKRIDLNNLEEHINITNKNLLRLIALDSSIEDFISIFKRLSHKNILNFTVVLKFIRTLTREQFKLRYCRDKLIKDN